MTNEELIYACNEYKKMLLTDEYLKSEQKIRAYNEKMQDFIISHNIPFDSLKNKDLTLKLIKHNLAQTKFKSVAEAELYINEMESSTEELEKRNKYLYELISKATPEQFMKINRPFFDRVKSELDHK